MQVLVPIWVWWLLVGMNAFVFLLAVGDKMNAQRGKRRIRERTLLGGALLGGSLGLLVGMVLVRHKVRKPSFLLRLLMIVVVQAVIVTYVYFA